MKNIYKILLLAFLAVSFAACEDLDKDPFEANGIDGPFGTFIRLDITTSPVLDVTDIQNTSFGGTLSAPSGNVASYEMRVRRVSGGVATDYAPLFSATSFPAEFTATASSLATALGITVPDLLPGDRFDFEASSVGKDGTVVNFDNFGPNLQGGPGEAQGYRFVTFISCPFIQDDAVGTYNVTVDGFNSGGLNTGTFEVVAGSNSGQLILQNPYGSPDPDDVGYNVKVDITPFGIATVEDQPIFDTDATGNGGFFDTETGNGQGFVFSCSGAIVLTWDLTLEQISSGSNFIFTPSPFAFTAEKQ